MAPNIVICICRSDVMSEAENLRYFLFVLGQPQVNLVSVPCGSIA